jgi:hypothetical protein
MRPRRKNNNAVAPIIFILLVMWFFGFCSDSADAGERRQMNVDKDGKHLTLLDPGECDASGCVLLEGETVMWDDGPGYLYQFMDEDGDETCDHITVWKPLVDPTHGTYYAIYKTQKGCEIRYDS